MEPEWKLLHADIVEIKGHVIELVKQGAVNNQTLIEHERRSTNLEERFKPIEADHIYLSRLGKTLMGLGGLLGILKVILELKKLI